MTVDPLRVFVRGAWAGTLVGLAVAGVGLAGLGVIEIVERVRARG